jgi:polar amino acid transport system substrate-binding protein
MMVFLCLCWGSAQAREVQFFTVEVTPWADYDAKSGARSGVFPDLVAELARRTGHHITQQFMPFARLERELESGAEDCGIFIWSDSRAAIAEKGEIVYQFPVGVVARKGVPVNSYDDLHSMTVSIIRGLSISPDFDQDPKIKKDLMTDYLNGLQELAHQRVDGIMGALWTIRFTAKKEGLDKFLGGELTLASEPLALQCSKKSANIDLMPEFNRTLRDMQADGTTAKIFRKNYVGVTGEP